MVFQAARRETSRREERRRHRRDRTKTDRVMPKNVLKHLISPKSDVKPEVVSSTQTRGRRDASNAFGIVKIGHKLTELRAKNRSVRPPSGQFSINSKQVQIIIFSGGMRLHLLSATVWRRKSQKHFEFN